MRKLNWDFSAAQRCSYIFFTGKTDDLVPYLNALQFRNGPSFVYANQSFGLQQFCVLYTEPENVSTIRFGWDTLGLRSYLFQNPGDPKMQRSPPMGMRSAVPLGGLGKSDLEVISYETWEKKNPSKSFDTIRPHSLCLAVRLVWHVNVKSIRSCVVMPVQTVSVISITILDFYASRNGIIWAPSRWFNPRVDDREPDSCRFSETESGGRGSSRFWCPRADRYFK